MTEIINWINNHLVINLFDLVTLGFTIGIGVITLIILLIVKIIEKVTK